MATAKQIGQTIDLLHRVQKLQARHHPTFVDFLGGQDAKAAKAAIDSLLGLYEELHMAKSIAEEGGLSA